MAAIAADKKVGIKKFTATGFSELKKNNKVILQFVQPTDILIEGGKLSIADETNSLKPIKK